MRMPSIEPGLVASGEILQRLAERRRIARVGGGERIQHQRAIFDAARHRADRIERPAEQHGAGKADAAERDLQADQAVERRGDAHRAAGVAADAGRRQPRGDGHAGAARRAAGHAMGLQVPGIPRRAHQRIGAPAAEGELDHVQLAERHHAGGGQPLDRVGGLGGHALLEHLRAAGADACRRCRRDPCRRSAGRAAARAGSRRRAPCRRRRPSPWPPWHRPR